MKKIFFTIMALGLFITSCNNDDDNSSSQTELSGTQWTKSTDSNRHFTFTSTTEYVYSENGSTHPGTYVFDGTNGTMTETGDDIDFKVNNDILSVNQDTSDPDFESLYTKQ
ncbi:MAG: hypothetical protein L3J08_06670 [Flavobacteriaceae bacterium]|nr:hypothetical protein [Flavobacteriaceae bacterium]